MTRPATAAALTVAVLTAVGAAVRLVVLQDSLFADELSTHWIISSNGLGGVIATVHTDAEITPPLYFVLAWLATRIDLTPELLRAPSLLAGVAAVPLTYLLGARTVGRQPGLVAAALTALSPFMIFYSTEARGYGLMVVLVLVSTLFLLAAVDGGRRRSWVGYAICSCAAVYTHYTAVFGLGAQLLWVLWAHPPARRGALLANLAAVVAFLPWLSGLIADLESPTTKILGALEPFNFDTVRVSLGHWSLGYPYGFVGLGSVPGAVGLVLIGAGVAVAMVVIGAGALGRPRTSLAQLDRRLTLILALALAAPVGEAVVSVVGSDILGTRNLAVSWPAFALLLASLFSATRLPVRIGAAALLIAGFGIGAARMLESKHQRPDYAAAAAFIDRNASPRDVVIDASVLSPGPVAGLDTALEQPRLVLRAEAPQERDHPFGFLDPIWPLGKVIHDALAAADGGRIFLVSLRSAEPVPGRPTYSQLAGILVGKLPGDYRHIESRTYPGIVPVAVRMYERPGTPGNRPTATRDPG